MTDSNATECPYCEVMTRVGTETYLGDEIPHGVFNTIFGFNNGGRLYVIRQGTPEGDLFGLYYSNCERVFENDVDIDERWAISACPMCGRSLT